MSKAAKEASRKIRILVADDYPVIRRGVVSVFAAQLEMEVVAEAADASEVMSGIARAKPDVVLLDLGMPGVRGLEIVRQLRDDHAALGILVYTMQREEDIALACLKAGANGFLHKTAPEPELVRAVQLASEGLRYLSPAMTEKVVAELPLPPDLPPHNALSDRELHVLCLLAEGKRPAAIASQLGISVKTVHTYRGRIFDKLGVRTTVDIVLYAAEHHLLGWAPPDERSRLD